MLSAFIGLVMVKLGGPEAAPDVSELTFHLADACHPGGVPGRGVPHMDITGRASKNNHSAQVCTPSCIAGFCGQTYWAVRLLTC
mgnify:CR=1 FL=1